MGNYTSSNTDLNPLGIPDSHFDKYGLNEEKTVMIFEVTRVGELQLVRYPHSTTGYTTYVKFYIPDTNGVWSGSQKFETRDKVITDDFRRYYDKNLGYLVPKTEEDEISLDKKYKIRKFSVEKQPVQNIVLDEPSSPPSINF